MATQRGYYREELERATKNIDMCFVHLVRVLEAYAVPHPEIASQVQVAGDGLDMVRSIIVKIHDSI